MTETTSAWQRWPWITLELTEAMSLDRPGIYAWRVGDDCYVGQSRRLRKRIAEYPRNVDRLLAGTPYRVTGRDYRRVHRALADAARAGQSVVVTILENCERELLNERERHWRVAIGTLNG